MKVYLSGHIPKEDEIDWRNEITEPLNQLIKSGAIIFLTPREIHGAISDHIIPDSLNTTKSNVHATRDEMYMNQCDVALINLDWNIGMCLGCMFEFGYLYALHKPTILLNHHGGQHRTHFLQHKASVTVYNLQDAISVLEYMVK